MHAHLPITTRRTHGEEFSAKKARDAKVWGVLWRDHQKRQFPEHGLDLQVDPTTTHTAEHIGLVRMRRPGSEILRRAEVVRQANAAAARHPD